MALSAPTYRIGTGPGSRKTPRRSGINLVGDATRLGLKLRFVQTRLRAWSWSPAPSLGIVTLQHPSRKLISQRVEVLAEVHFIVHPRFNPSNPRKLTRLRRFLGQLLKQLLSDVEVVSCPSLLLR